MRPFVDETLIEFTDAVAPPLIDLAQLERLVTDDERADAFSGECAEHDGCRPVFERRLA